MGRLLSATFIFYGATLYTSAAGRRIEGFGSPSGVGRSPMSISNTLFPGEVIESGPVALRQLSSTLRSLWWIATDDIKANNRCAPTPKACARRSFDERWTWFRTPQPTHPDPDESGAGRGPVAGERHDHGCRRLGRKCADKARRSGHGRRASFQRRPNGRLSRRARDGGAQDRRDARQRPSSRQRGHTAVRCEGRRARPAAPLDRSHDAGLHGKHHHQSTLEPIARAPRPACGDRYARHRPQGRCCLLTADQADWTVPRGR